jgi:hypothetical protein
MAGIINILVLIAIGIGAAISLVGIPLIPIYCLLVFYKSNLRTDKAEKKLMDTLMKDESLIAKGLQSRPFAFYARRKLIGITNSRIILIARGLLGGFTMQDFQWKDLHDAKLSENALPDICGSNLSFVALNQAILIPGVETRSASDIYKRAQAEEQAWEEKRRVRGLEEMRAAAGGVTVHSAPGQQSTSEAPTKSSGSVTEELQKAKALLDAGAINDAEFQEIKSKILSKNF